MFWRICACVFAVLGTIATPLSAEVKYSLLEIGTLQTRESAAIAINNRNQILGWFNVDGTSDGKHFFLRNENGIYNELPGKDFTSGLPIHWEYLTNCGKVYGYVDVSSTVRDLYVWSKENSVACLGHLPGKEIISINDMDQVLINSAATNKDGKSVSLPAIWHKGKVTFLPALTGDLGVEAVEAHALAMNNIGFVVGESDVLVNYKNQLYKQKHAAMWLMGAIFDLQDKINERSLTSSALLVNDRGEIYVKAVNHYLLGKKNKVVPMPEGLKRINNNYVYNEHCVYKTDGTQHLELEKLNEKLSRDHDSDFLQVDRLISINDKGNIVAQSTTIYGEKHAVLLMPGK